MHTKKKKIDNFEPYYLFLKLKLLDLIQYLCKMYTLAKTLGQYVLTSMMQKNARHTTFDIFMLNQRLYIKEINI